MSTALTVDHVFLCVGPGGGAPGDVLRKAGYEVVRQRRHVGQGTANLCFRVGGVLVELLWEVDEDELGGPVPALVSLAPRVRREPGTCPLGVAVAGGPLPTPSFRWAPTFLPEGSQLDVAVDSVDPAQPLVFLAPEPGESPAPSWITGRMGPGVPLVPSGQGTTPLTRALDR